MNNTQPARRPYGATANHIAVFERARTRNLPETINNDFLRIAGVPDVVFGRVTEGLQFLGAIDPDGTPTAKMRALASAEYRELLAQMVRDAYREDFQNIDPAQDDQSTIIDAFRRYEPRSQTSRMVMLFLGMCREAGIPVKDAPRERKMQNATSKNTSKPRQPKQHRVTVTAGAAGRVTTETAPPIPNMLFGVTNDDIAALDDNDFIEVWAALGKVARARSRASAPVAVAETVYSDEDDDEDENPM
jgi:hypothetical protein